MALKNAPYLKKKMVINKVLHVDMEIKEYMEGEIQVNKFIIMKLFM